MIKKVFLWLRAFIKNHFVLFCIIISTLPTILSSISIYCQMIFKEGIFRYPYVIFAGGILGITLVYPFILTISNILFLFYTPSNDKLIKSSRYNEYITIFLGCIYTLLYTEVSDISYLADYESVLINSQRHAPIFTGALLSIIVLSIIGIIGYVILRLNNLSRMSPIIVVMSFSFVYIGIIVSFLWVAQIFSVEDCFLCILPINLIVIALKLIKEKIKEWNNYVNDNEFQAKTYKNNLLNRINIYLMDSRKWPIAAFVLMIPIMGILICILCLFGQEPDSIIKAWTETSDWNLSTKVSPQNIKQDEHYLCTVAAGGHPSIVKPIRRGIRHGHEVVVNRQLLVANAFEDIISEKTPNFHKIVRYIYDKYGFPVARLIKSKYTADLVYFIMKPLEIVFLFVIYTCDVKPENRIAVQYTGKSINDFK